MAAPSILTRRRPAVAALAAAVPLGGCDLVVMNPAGDVARQQADLILWSTGLMLIVIVPVMVLTVIFAWRYRQGNADAEYAPDWDHSTGLELVIWSVPLLIIIALGALTWVGTHTLDPYRPIGRIAPGRPLPAAQRPLEVQVVSLDWKWLFIYPEQGIATVNTLVLPANRQVRFRLSSSSVMNTFWVPAMAGMIYTMPGMETKLHAVLNRSGRFEGRSGNYSGKGFSEMDFWTRAVEPAAFERWASDVRGTPGRLDAGEYLRLEKPSEDVRPTRYGAVAAGLFDRIVGMCVHPGERCMSMGGHGDGVAPPVNSRPARAGEPEGALMKEPGEKASSPHMTAPSGQSPGTRDPGAPANRNMTSLDRPALPGAAETARA